MPPKKKATKKDDVANPSNEDAGIEQPAANATRLNDHVILQLPIPPARLRDVMDNTSMNEMFEYNPVIVDPQPYTPVDAFHSVNDELVESFKDDAAEASASTPGAMQDSQPSNNKPVSHGCVCYWCCHAIPHIEYGMPIRYDVFHRSFTVFGSFCSLECVAAYNFTTHMGSDRVWEIHSWIQMMANRYGYTGHVRPAPSRYLLKMFNGPLSIEEFREAHKGLARTYAMNIPPFIHVVSHMEVLNTSFLDTTAKKPKRVAAAAKGTAGKTPSLASSPQSI